MKITGIVKKGEYFDSVSIMLVAKQLSTMEGIADSAVVMATDENKAMLTSSGLFVPEFQNTGEMDLIIVFKSDDNSDVTKITMQIEKLLKPDKKNENDAGYLPSSIEEAVTYLPGANLAMISVAGRYAG